MTPVETNSTQGTGYLVAAGIFVGIGTRMAKDCTSGHGVSGVSGLSLRGIVATAVYIEAGVLTVFAISNF
ncbi:YeeE/YedE thiosulfate transporter family protein [Ascidiaceihabitans sp.]|nr:YeeE/YedE thiosulfate transporter family protein [Ascidiaceihabitans sp.]